MINSQIYSVIFLSVKFKPQLGCESCNTAVATVQATKQVLQRVLLTRNHISVPRH